MATPSTIGKDEATILLNVFDGTRQPIGPRVKNLLVRIIDGNQKQLFSDFRNGSSFQFHVPFYDNFGDRYTLIASADHHSQAGATPVNAQRGLPQTVDLMILDKNGSFNFAGAIWNDLPQKFPEIHSILAQGAATAGETRETGT